MYVMVHTSFAIPEKRYEQKNLTTALTLIYFSKPTKTNLNILAII